MGTCYPIAHLAANFAVRSTGPVGAASILTPAPRALDKPSARALGLFGSLTSNARLLLALGAVVAYCPSLARSLWVDEANSYWMACRGPFAAIQRTSHWPGQSLLYAVITSFFCFDGSPLRDLLLRVPALLGAAAACYFLYRFAEDAIGAGAGRITALIFAFNPATIELATEARSYALAMAAVAASCWTLYRWADSRQRSWLAAWVVSSTLIIYLHYLFSFVFAVHALFLLYELGFKRRLARAGEMLAGYVVIALLTVPLAPHIRLLLHESHTLPFGAKPTAVSLAELLMPPAFMAGIFAAGLLVHFAWPDRAPEPPRLKPALPLMLLAWWCLGPLLFFAVSSTTTMMVFVDRYLSYSGMAFALLISYAGYSIFGKRRSYVWALLVVLLTTGNVLKLAGQWRPGDHEVGPFMRVIQDESANSGPHLPPVMFQSSLIESNFYNWRSGNSPQSYLYAPFVAYPMKNKLVPLPFSVTADVEDYVANELKTELKDEAKVILVLHDVIRIPWFDERFKEAGFNSRVLHLNDYWVMVFERGKAESKLNPLAQPARSVNTPSAGRSILSTGRSKIGVRSSPSRNSRN